MIVPTGFKEDRWITQVEVRPWQSRRCASCQRLHPRTGLQLASRIPNGEVVCSPEERGERVGTGGSSSTQQGSAGASVREQVIAGCHSPGRPASAKYRMATRCLFRRASDLVFQLHYTTNGKPATDVTRIGFVFAKSAPLKRVIRVQASNAGFVIPAGAPGLSGFCWLGRIRRRLRAAECVPAHAPAREIDGLERRLLQPGEREEFGPCPSITISIWQLVYSFSKPLARCRKGTILKADATFDNSCHGSIQSKSQAYRSCLGRPKLGRDDGRVLFDLAIPIATDPASAFYRGPVVKTRAASPVPTRGCSKKYVS